VVQPSRIPVGLDQKDADNACLAEKLMGSDGIVICIPQRPGLFRVRLVMTHHHGITGHWLAGRNGCTG